MKKFSYGFCPHPKSRIFPSNLYFLEKYFISFSRYKWKLKIFQILLAEKIIRFLVQCTLAFRIILKIYPEIFRTNEKIRMAFARTQNQEFSPQIYISLRNILYLFQDNT